MGLKGKFLGERSGSAIFGSKNKPEWKPIYPSPQFDIHSLQAGEYYDLNLEDNRLVSATKLAPMTGARPQQSFGPETSNFQNPQHVQNVAQMVAPREAVPVNGLMASATGIAKSLIENGEPYEVAGRMAIHWAQLWGPAPDWRALPSQDVVKAPSVAPVKPEPPSADPNDDIPF